MDPIELFVDFSHKTTYADIPLRTVKATKSVLIDFFGVMLGGTASRQSRLCADIVNKWAGIPKATVFPTGGKVPLHTAVLVNCTAGRALDYDDVHEQAHVHATVAVVPTALAISETKQINGREFLVSIVLGFELLARIGLALTKGPGATGMSTTYQGASLAAALVGAKLLQLDPNATRNAVGIAYSQLAGNQQVIREGVDLMIIQQGLSAMSGMVAVELAQMGLTGPKEVLSGRYGYFPVYHPGRHDISAFAKNLGKEWEIENTSLKPFPCCKHLHTAVQAALDLRAEHCFSPEEIAEVQVRIGTEAYDMVCEPIAVKRNPSTLVDAIYSMPYALSVALTKGRIGLEDFTIKAIKRQDMLKFAEIVHPIRDMNIKKIGDKGRPAWVTIKLKNKKELRSYKEVVKGNPDIPMSKEEVNAKFFDCLAYAGYPENVANRLLEALEHVENIDDISTLVSLCCRPNSKWKQVF